MIIEISHELEGTIFDVSRFNESNRLSLKYGEDGTYIKITEALLNEALTNITVSALSLGTWWRMTPVSFIRYQNTYRFSNHLYLILPYGVSIGLAMVFTIVALWSCWRNDNAATDGGFIQIMLATRGATEMERLVLKEGCTSADNMPQELKQLKLRYGQLTVGQNIGVDEIRMGFGTVDETICLKKRHRFKPQPS